MYLLTFHRYALFKYKFHCKVQALILSTQHVDIIIINQSLVRKWIILTECGTIQ